MTTLTTTAADSAVMIRRNLIRLRRYPAMLVSMTVMPVVLFLMFTLFFGEALGSGLDPDGPLGGRYVNYVTPGMLLMIPAFLTVSVAVSVCQDMTSGFVNRLRTTATPPTAILAGPVVGALLQAC